MDHIYDSIIIGGGISGLYLLDNLLKRYKSENICLLEKYPYLGGKIRTLYDNENKVLFEKGPWRFSEKHKLLMEFLNKLDINYKQNTSSNNQAEKINFNVCNKSKKNFKIGFNHTPGLTYKNVLTKKNGKCKSDSVASLYKLPLIMDSTSKPNDKNLDYEGKFYFIEKGFSHIIKKLNDMHQKFIQNNSMVTNVKYNSSSKIYTLFISVRNKNIYTCKKMYTRNVFICLPPIFTEKWDIVQDNLLPLIYSVDTLPLHHIYAHADNIKDFYDNKFYINTNY